MAIGRLFITLCFSTIIILFITIFIPLIIIPFITSRSSLSIKRTGVIPGIPVLITIMNMIVTISIIATMTVIIPWNHTNAMTLTNKTVPICTKRTRMNGTGSTAEAGRITGHLLQVSAGVLLQPRKQTIQP